VAALLEARQHTLVQGAYGVNERKLTDLLAFFETLRDRGLNPRSCTIDGNPHVARALRQTWPQITLQRCLVHVQRQGIRWCRQQPKRLDARKLHTLFLQLLPITTIEERDPFLADVAAWEQHYGTKIDARPERGRVFSDLKRARSMLLAALPDMFHYLNDPNIPRSTNGIEGYFSRLKRLYRNHNGLNKLENYCKWYFHFVRK
jgi:transposase-like protein